MNNAAETKSAVPEVQPANEPQEKATGYVALAEGGNILLELIPAIFASTPELRDSSMAQLARALKALEEPDAEENWPGVSPDDAKRWVLDALMELDLGSMFTASNLDTVWNLAPEKESAIRKWGVALPYGNKKLEEKASARASMLVKCEWAAAEERRKTDALRAALPKEAIVHDTSTGEYVVRGPNGDWSRRMKKDGIRHHLSEHGYRWEKHESFLSSILTVDGGLKAYGQPAGPVVVNGVRRLNTWRPGPAKPMPGVFPNIELLLLNLCGGVTSNVEWLKRWMASWLQPVLQKGVPQKTGLAPVFYGVPGGGKNTLNDIIVAMVGPEEVLLLNQGALDSQFDPPLEGKLFVFANEVVSSTNRTRETANRLKEMVTEPVLPIQLKHKDPRNVYAPINAMFASNDPRALYIEPDDRRFAVFRSRQKLDRAVAAAIHADLGNRGMFDGPLVEVGAFMYHLLNHTDLLAPGELIDTLEKKQMITETGMSNVDEFLRELREEGAYGMFEQYRDALRRRGRDAYVDSLVFVHDDEHSKGVRPEDLYLAYQLWCKDRSTSPCKKATFDNGVIDAGYKKNKRTSEPRVWIWDVPVGEKPAWMTAIETK